MASGFVPESPGSILDTAKDPPIQSTPPARVHVVYVLVKSVVPLKFVSHADGRKHFTMGVVLKNIWWMVLPSSVERQKSYSCY